MASSHTTFFPSQLHSLIYHVFGVEQDQVISDNKFDLCTLTFYALKLEKKVVTHFWSLMVELQFNTIWHNFEIIFTQYVNKLHKISQHKISLMHFNPKKIILIYRNKANLILGAFCKLFLHSPSQFFESYLFHFWEKVLLFPHPLNEADLNYKTNFQWWYE